MKTTLLIILVLLLSASIRAATFTVNSNADTHDASTADNVCADSSGNCTLRAAIEESNSLPAVPGGNFILFDGINQNIINLTLGALVISSDVNIFGSNARQLVIRRDTNSGTPNFRVFTIFKSPARNAQVIVNINKMTIANGATASGGGGVYVPVDCVLALIDVVVRNNTALDSSGGGIRADGTIFLVRSLIAENTASQGGGLNNQPGSVALIDNSTFTNNRAVGIPVSSIPAYGGGIASFAQMTLNNVTISRNTSIDNVGGILTTGGNNCRIRNTIIADNTASANSDLQGFFTSLGNNFIGNNGGVTFSLPAGNPNSDGDRVGTPTAPLNPLLGPLRDNGGQTNTLGLLPGSSAIDAGNNCVVDRSCSASNPSSSLMTDQRGTGFNRKVGTAVDIGAFERQASEIAISKLFDFDGDGQADIAVFRPSNGTWYLLNSQTGFGGVQFGQNGDRIVPADYDGDGKTDVAVYRNGYWYVLQSSNNGFNAVNFGESADIPMPADYDGDGKTDVAVFRSSNSTWYQQQTTGGFRGIQFGQSGDKPVAADFDGDGKSDIVVFRPSNGTWYIQQTAAGFKAQPFGISEDKPVAADYDGDGKTDIAVFRPSNGTWYLQTSTAGFAGIQFGQAEDLPTVADFDGDGKADIAVYRANTWYLLRTTQGFAGVQFGTNGDLPIQNAFVR